MKKILLYTRPIIPPWDEASKNLAYDIARTHNCDALEFHVLSLKNTNFKVQNIHHKNIITEKIYSSARLGITEKLQILGRLYRLNTNADVIHFLFTPRSLTSALIKARLSFSHVKTMQTVATVPEMLYTQPKAFKEAFFSDRVVAQSHYTQTRLQKAGTPNVEMIYPGIDLDRFKPAAKDPALLKQLDLDEKDIVFLFAGEFTRINGIDEVVEAFQVIKKKSLSQFEKIKLLIACRIKSRADLDKRQALEKTVATLGLSENVVFYDEVKDMPALYNLSDAQIFFVKEMSGKVDVPYVLIESMACKKPLIVSDIPVLEEVVEDGVDGLVSPSGSSEILAEKIIDLALDAKKRSLFAQNALLKVQENFDIKKNIKQYEKIYLEL